ncbi:MAG TPA: hypothetical protein VK883_00335, partial [Arthrobacter sp.]|nr:hypothetical protein [Arthrobacter sp.]
AMACGFTEYVRAPRDQSFGRPPARPALGSVLSVAGLRPSLARVYGFDSAPRGVKLSMVV